MRLRRPHWFVCALLAALPVQASAQPAVTPSAVATPAAAPPKPGLSLEEAIRLSLRSSNDAIRIEDEKVNSAAAKLKQASGAFDWTVSGEGGYET
jgi:outer membrane protein TolC